MNTLLAVLQLTATLAMLTLAGVFVVVALRARRKVREIEGIVRDFVSAPDSSTPSALAQTVDAAAQLAARVVIAQAKTTLMGMQSGAARSEAAAQRRAATEAFPWLGVLQKLSPQLSGTLMRNPQLLNLAGNLVAKAAQPGAGGAPPGPPGPAPRNGHTQEPLFKL